MGIKNKALANQPKKSIQRSDSKADGSNSKIPKPILNGVKNGKKSISPKRVRFDAASKNAKNEPNNLSHVSVTEEVDSDEDDDLDCSTLLKKGIFVEQENSSDDSDIIFLGGDSASDEESDDDEDDILAALWDESDSEEDEPSSVAIEEIKDDNLRSQEIVKTPEKNARKRVHSEEESPIPLPVKKRMVSNNDSEIKKKLAKENQHLKTEPSDKMSRKEFIKLKRKFKAQERKKKKRAKNATTEESVNIKTEPLVDNQGKRLVETIAKRQNEIQKRSLFIHPIPSDCSYVHLKSIFPSMTGCHIPIKFVKKNEKGKVKKQPRGYAFVEFASESEVQKQLKSFKDEKSVNELFQRFKIPEFVPKKPLINIAHDRNKGKTDLVKYDFRKLVVGGLPSTVPMDELKNLFPNCKINLSKQGSSHHGYCILEFTDENIAKKIFWEKHGVNLNDSPLCLTFLVLRKKCKQT